MSKAAIGQKSALDHKMSIKFSLHNGYASAPLKAVLYKVGKDIYKTETKFTSATSLKIIPLQIEKKMCNMLFVFNIKVLGFSKYALYVYLCVAFQCIS